jgi:hypothetical protein
LISPSEKLVKRWTTFEPPSIKYFVLSFKEKKKEINSKNKQKEENLVLDESCEWYMYI